MINTLTEAMIEIKQIQKNIAFMATFENGIACILDYIATMPYYGILAPKISQVAWERTFDLSDNELQAIENLAHDYNFENFKPVESLGSYYNLTKDGRLLVMPMLVDKKRIAFNEMRQVELQAFSDEELLDFLPEISAALGVKITKANLA